MIADVFIESEFIYERLERPDLNAGERLDKEFGSRFAEVDPVVPTPAEFVWRILPPLGCLGL